MITAMLLTVSLGVVFQDPPAETKPPRKGDAIVLKGCLSGATLETSDTIVSERHQAVTYRLTGKKALLESIRKEHSGHLDLVHGVLRTDPPKAAPVRRTEIGRTGISIGIGGSRGMAGDPLPPVPVLEVKELEHTEVLCGQRR